MLIEITEKNFKTINIELQQQEVLELISRIANASATFERNKNETLVSFPAILIDRNQDPNSMVVERSCPSTIVFRIEGKEQLEEPKHEKHNTHVKKYKKHHDEAEPEET